ncbi:MAG: methionine--tRNA ligase, partial [Spirochaetia bacterium]
PWKTRKENPEAAATLLMQLVYLVRDLGIMVEPFIPQTARKILDFVGQPEAVWKDVGSFEGISKVAKPDLLLKRIEDDSVKDLRERFSGSQKERKEKKEMEERQAEEKKTREEQGAAVHGKSAEKEGSDAEKEKAAAEEKPLEELFPEKVDLRIAEITNVERHPEADKLYVEVIDAGGGEERTIVSGLVPYYTAEELQGKKIILVYNLKPAKIRGVKSIGMLLAAEKEGDENRETVEVIDVPEAENGTRLTLEGRELPAEAPKKLKIDDFFKLPITVKDYTVMVGDAALTVNGKPVKTSHIKDGKVG